MAEQPEKRGLFRLLADVPGLIIQLFRDELESFKAELTRKATGMAVGAGILAGAAAVAFLALVVLVLAAVFALSLVMDPWAAALIVALVLIVIAGILVFVGLQQLKKGDLNKTVQSVQRDVYTIKGTGRRD
jgi:cytochrome c biogenesis protein CcdA